MTKFQNAPFVEIKSNGRTSEQADIPFADLNDLAESEPEKLVLGDAMVVFGIWFWEYNFKAKKWLFKGLYRNGFFALLESKGYFKRFMPDGKQILWIRDENGIIEEVSIAHLVDVAKDVVSQQEDIGFEHDGNYLTATGDLCREKFKAQFHLIFNPSSLLNLTTHKKAFFNDTATSSYFFYQNVIVEITADRPIEHPYQLLNNRCVWKSQIVRRDFDPKADGANSEMAVFDWNTCDGIQDVLKTRKSAYGYMLHRHNSPIRNQVAIFVDKVINSAKEARGRTGKGLSFRAILQVRPGCLIDGKGIKDENQFWLQLVELHHTFVCIDDPKPNFDFKRLYSAVTEGLTIEKKGRQSIQIPAAQSPKFLILTNTVLDNAGTSNKARQFVVEFGDHYSKQIIKGNEEPIREEHGCVFFSEDWDVEEWARFDQYMLSNVQFYLKYGLIPPDMSNVAANRLRQTTGDDFYEWATEYNNGTGLQPGIAYDSTHLFQQFKTIYQVDEKDLRQRGFTNNLKKYGASKEWDFKRKTGGPSGGFWYVAKTVENE
jgi:hypothetical protein